MKGKMFGSWEKLIRKQIANVLRGDGQRNHDTWRVRVAGSQKPRPVKSTSPVTENHYKNGYVNTRTSS